ncbi:MAG: hypothetical protein H6817_03710 [Phycisphaerales bacterium]|nr:hypothetical protein [Phycisphaerales bacterium]
MSKPHRWPIQSVAAILILTAITTPAAGTVLTIEFDGVIDFVEDTLPFSDTIGIGTPFEGSYSYDSDTPDNFPNDPTAGGYSFPNSSMSFKIGDLAFSTPDLRMTIWDISLFDVYEVSNSSPFSAHGVDWGLARITLRDDTGTALASDALPVNAPDLEDFDFARALLLRRIDQRESSIKGTVTSIRLVPEPGTLTFLATGLFLCAHRRTSR